MLRKNSKRNLRIAAGLASVCAALFVICFANGIFGERAKRVPERASSASSAVRALST